jgi:aryl-alcohol dehydrogenase-like predicted oxidoreductase
MKDDHTSSIMTSPDRRKILRYGAALGATASFSPALSFAADAPLISRAIPRTGEMMPVVGIGTSRVFDIGSDRDEWRERQSVLQHLFDGGAKLIDTAPSYQEAEEVIGQLLQAMGARNRAFLATKVWADGKAEGDEQIAESFRRLRTDRIDLFQVHNLSDTDTQIASLRALKDAGKARYVGITHYRESYNEALAAALRRHKPDFVQLEYSLNQTSAEQTLLPLAADLGIAVLVNRPFGRGHMFRRVRGRKLPPWAAEFDAKSWAQFFLKFILSHPTVNCVIPGTDRVKYMVDNLGAGRGRLPNAEQRRRMVRFWASI